MTPSRVVTLRDEVEGQDRRRLWTHLDERGNLHIDGQDLGPTTAIVSDDGEHEWFKTVHAEHLPLLAEQLGGPPGCDVLQLLAERFSGRASYELERVLREVEFPVDLFVT